MARGGGYGKPCRASSGISTPPPHRPRARRHDDVADLIEQHGYRFWTFHSYGEFYGWNLESIRDEETGKLRNIRDGETTDRLEVMKRHWARNRE